MSRSLLQKQIDKQNFGNRLHLNNKTPRENQQQNIGNSEMKAGRTNSESRNYKQKNSSPLKARNYTNDPLKSSIRKKIQKSGVNNNDNHSSSVDKVSLNYSKKPNSTTNATKKKADCGNFFSFLKTVLF